MKKIVSVFLILIMLFSSGCSSQISKPLKETTSSPPAGLSLNEIKKNIKFIINKDLWESGYGVQFKFVLGKKSDYKIYNNEKEKAICVLFSKIHTSSDGSKFYYFFNIKYNKYGMESYVDSFYVGGYSLKEMNRNIVKKLKFIGSGSIMISKPSKPIFLKTTFFKKRIIKKVKKLVVSLLKHFDVKGTYKVYIANFFDADLYAEIYIFNKLGDYYYTSFMWSENKIGSWNDLDLSGGRNYSKADKIKQFNKTVFIKKFSVTIN